MSEDLFFKLVIIASGFAVLPILLVLFFSVFHKKFNQILTLISLVEFLTNSANLLIYYTKFGYFKEQFYIYYILEIVCWVYILGKFYFKFEISIILTVLLLFCLSILTFYRSFYAFEFISKIIQFILGVNMFMNQIKDSKTSTINHSLIFASIGIMIYAFLTINLFIFKNILVDLNLDDFAFTWGVHQIAAVIYFSLLSISIWKSQKI